MTTDLELFYDRAPHPGFWSQGSVSAQRAAQLAGAEHAYKRWCASLGNANRERDPARRRYYQAAAMRQINYYRRQVKLLLSQAKN